MEVNDVLALTDIIDFLITLMRDEDAQQRFADDPDAALADAGLDGLTGQDVRDARLVMADSGAGEAGDGADPSYDAGADPVAEIQYTTRHYHAGDNVHVDSGDRFGGLVDRSSTVITIDDRDTTTIVQDSFNSDSSTTEVTVVDDITTTDIDVIDIDADNSFNEDNDVTAIQDNDVVNEDNDVVAIQDNDVVNEDNDTVVENSGNVLAPDDTPPDDTEAFVEDAPVEDAEPDPFDADADAEGADIEADTSADVAVV